jgi:hypothetical protein
LKKCDKKNEYLDSVEEIENYLMGKREGEN